MWGALSRLRGLREQYSRERGVLSRVPFFGLGNILDKKQPILILGVGNILLKDEGFGVHVARRLMDMEMPVMDGLKAASEIRRIPACENIPIVAMTAHVMEEHRQLALNSGMDDYISKPIEMRDLNNILIKLLGREKAVVHQQFIECSEDPDPEPDHFPGIDFEDGLNRLAGDRDLYLQVLSFFYTTYARSRGILSVSLQEGRKQDAVTFVHSINGATGNIGARRLFETGKKIETVLSTFQNNVSTELIECFEDELEKVLQGLMSLQEKDKHETFGDTY